jgi:hypothetical protein
MVLAKALMDFGCKLSYCRSKGALDTEDSSFIFVVLAGPEETFQSILSTTRYDMDV